MEEFESKLKEAKVAELTVKTYVIRLRKTMEDYGAEDAYELVKNPDKYIARMEEGGLKASTVAGRVSAILRFQEHVMGMNADRKVETFDTWNAYYKKVKAIENKTYDASVPTKEEWGGFKTKYGDIVRKVEERGIVEGDRDLRQLLMATFAYMPPKRADLGAVRIVKSIDERPEKGEPVNFIDMSSVPAYMEIRVHKTAKHFGPIVEDAYDMELDRRIRASLEARPREYLFVDTSGKPMSKNAYTKYVKRAMKEIMGEEIPVTVLRHKYITEMMDMNRMTAGEKKEIARRMGHSVTTQVCNYHWVE